MKITPKIILLPVLVLIATYSMGQPYLALRPSIGLQRDFAKIVNDKNSASTFRNNTYEEGAEFGLWLDYVTKGYSFSAGIVSGSAGFSYSVSIPEPKSPSSYLIASTAIGNPLLSFPLKFSKRFQEVSLFPFEVIKKGKFFGISAEQGKENNRYLLVFKPILFGGIAYNYLQRSTQNMKTIVWGNYKDRIILNDEGIIRTRHGLSVFIGGTLQFRHKGKDRLAVTLYYSKGLRTLMNYDINYQLNTDSYNTSLGLKGTVIGANISFPVKLITFNKKN